MSWGFFNKIKKGIRKFIKWVKSNFTLNDEGKIVLIKDVVQKEPTLLDKIYAGLRKLKVPSFKDFSTKYLDSNLRSFYPSYIHFGVNGEIYDSGNLISLEKLYSTMLRMIFLKERRCAVWTYRSGTSSRPRSRTPAVRTVSMYCA